ncbi:hypothetical protein DC094_05775 [Pelagibaculum spongiae]|uniref:Uncharacterized protein n=1 Tax=Pelagibaculum spongiae TaxID=2080658 RepID=A0A2V1H3F5_9GAMM|nr:hypothetical protein DC094_05775 [Pelagibaculum spongiae]
MTIDKINITQTLDDERQALKQDQLISASTCAVFQIMLLVVELIANKLGFNSRNSSPPLKISIAKSPLQTNAQSPVKNQADNPAILEAR